MVYVNFLSSGLANALTNVLLGLSDVSSESVVDELRLTV